jgi:hypothetical protein
MGNTLYSDEFIIAGIELPQSQWKNPTVPEYA